MKSLLLIGGLLGFATGLFFSWLQESSWPASLWHASLAAYLTALLMRWWGHAWQRSLASALHERQTANPPVGLPALSKGAKS